MWWIAVSVVLILLGVWLRLPLRHVEQKVWFRWNFLPDALFIGAGVLLYRAIGEMSLTVGELRSDMFMDILGLAVAMAIVMLLGRGASALVGKLGAG